LTITDEDFSQDGKIKFKINQRYYLESGEETDQNKKWFIPLFINTDMGEQYFELTESDTEIVVNVKSKDSFVKVN